MKTYQDKLQRDLLQEANMTKICAVIYEDRESEINGIIELIESIFRNRLNEIFFSISLYTNNKIADLIMPFIKDVNIITDHGISPDYWNVKPAVFSKAFESDAQGVIWMDSDIIFTKASRKLINGMNHNVVYVAEEGILTRSPYYTKYSEGWGLPNSSALGFSTNSSFVYIPRRLSFIVDIWQFMLKTEFYQKSKHISWKERDPHVFGDQDALHALLDSDFCRDIEIRCLRSGRDIVHEFGPGNFDPISRIITVFRGTPAIIHAQRSRPWHEIDREALGGGKRYIFAVISRDLSSYFLESIRYSHNTYSDWKHFYYRSLYFYAAIFLFNPALSGFAISLYDFTRRYIGTWRSAHYKKSIKSIADEYISERIRLAFEMNRNGKSQSES